MDNNDDIGKRGANACLASRFVRLIWGRRLRRQGNQVEFVSDFMKEEAGANAAEYALILLVITVFIVTALSSIANGISNSVNAARVGLAS